MKVRIKCQSFLRLAQEIPLTDSGQGNLEGTHYGWVDARRKTELPGFKANPAQQEDMISSE